MKIELEYVRPADIERRSMGIIDSELGRALEGVNAPVIRRVIHTTADFDYADHLVFTNGAVEKGVAALKGGCGIVTDTTMALAGINKRVLPALIIGVPVGFVNVVEAKELILTLDTPAIVARGRKGGSNVAAAICNALLYLASDGERE